MRVRDILPATPIEKIEVRTNYPDRSELANEHDLDWGMLFGFCSWDGWDLIPLDGDNYYIDEDITGFLWCGDRLVYWIHSEWDS